MGGGQLGLLLWKNYVVRKRRPGILGLVFLWPVVVFMLLYTVRDNVDPEYNPTCQFPARRMPRDGLLPFVQSYICSIGNPCEPLDEYEQVPSYEKATLGPLMMELQPVLRNNTILEAVETLPQSVKFLKSMAEILTRPEIKKLFDRGIKLGDLFNNHDTVKHVLQSQMPGVREDLVDDLFEASIKLYYLIESFGSSNIDGIVCSPESLKQFIVVPKEQDLVTISQVLCNLDPNKIPEILERLARHLDFEGLLEVVSRVMAKFSDYDFISDIKRTIVTVLELNTLKKYVPSYLKLREWVPEVLELFRDVNFKAIDVSFINKSIEKMDPIFFGDRDWSTARHGLYKLNSILVIIKGIYDKNVTQETDKNIFELTHDISRGAQKLSDFSIYTEDITKVFDEAFTMVQDGVKLTNKLLYLHQDEIELTTEIFDNLRDIFPNKVMSTLTYLVSTTENIVRMIHHVAIIHEELYEKINNISKKHQETVKEFLTDMEPDIYRTIVKSFSQLDIAEALVESTKTKPIADVICSDEIFKRIFKEWSNYNVKSLTLNELICRNESKLLMTDIYNVFEFDNFRIIVENTLSTFVSMALTRPVAIDKSNLTSTVRSIRNLLYYLEHLPLKKLDWSEFNVSDKWLQVFNETRPLGRVGILGYHLSVAKNTGSKSLSYMTIKPDLENMDIIADLILKDLRENPTEWINQVREHEAELLESFYLTVSDRNKTLKILEYENFTHSYCVERNKDLLNYPPGSNVTLLKGLVCRLARAVQTELEINLTSSELQEMTFKDRNSFNWTAFNEKLVEIYAYVDTLVQFDGDSYLLKRFDELKRNFESTWTKDLTAENAWEISVGLLCRFFLVAESPLFNVQSKSAWRKLYAIAWSAATITTSIEHTIDNILDDNINNTTIKLSTVMKDMPQTEILIDTALRNLPAVTRDVIDILTQRNPIQLVTAINNHQKVELNWPCIFNQSVGDVLELRPGTKELIREIERISCNPGLFIREWEEHPTFKRVYEIIKNNNETIAVPSFNWTSGYTSFRRLIAKFVILINYPSDLALSSDEEGNNQHSIQIIPEVKKIIYQSLPKISEQSKNILEYVDMEIDKNIPVYKSNITAKEAWVSLTPRTLDEILVIVKFGSRVIHDVVDVILQLLGGDPKNINLLNVLGFTIKSPVSIVRDRFPYILATVIYGLTDMDLDNKIYTAINNNNNNKDNNESISITCTDIFTWFENYKTGLTDDEYRTLKNFTCDADPENFNAFIDLYLKETTIWNAPVSNYQLHFLSLGEQLYRLGELVKSLGEDFEINSPVDEKYFKDALITLKNVLEVPKATSTSAASKYSSEWSTYRLVIQGFSEVLDNAAFALKDVIKSEDNILHLWDFVKAGDVHQLVKYLESYPIETISFFATLSTYNTTSMIPFKDVRHTMCNLHFNSTYWAQSSGKHFLSRLCTWDQYELLKQATSEDYADFIHGKNTSFKTKPLSKSVTKFLDAWTKLEAKNKNKKINFESNILNVTTWKNLPNETHELIHDAEKSWIHKAVTELDPLEYEFIYEPPTGVDETGMHNFFKNHPLHTAVQVMQVTEVWLDVISGGDIWQKLRTTFEHSRVKFILNLMEDAPNLIITIVDTFLNSERLNDFMDKFLNGTITGCDIDKYLIPSGYIRKKGIISSITNFCNKIINSNDRLDVSDFKPLRLALNVFSDSEFNIFHYIEKDIEDNKMTVKAKLNESYFIEQLEMFQRTLIHALSDSYKSPRTPSWITSFQEASLNDFKKQFDTPSSSSKDLRSLAHSVVTKSTKVMKNIFISTADLRNNCSWCNTRVVEIINSQLANHEIYSEILCKFNRMNVSQIQEIIDSRLYWKKTVGMIKNFEFLSVKKDIDSFITAIESALHYIMDIVMDYKDPSSEKNLNECMTKAVDGIKNFSPGIYIKILVGVINALEKNIKVLELPSNREDLNNRTKLSEKFIPIWKPLRSVVKHGYIEEVDKLLPNASINVNLLVSDRNTSVCSNAACRNASTLNNILSSKKVHKLLRYDPKLSNYPLTSDISKLLIDGLDFDFINHEIVSWRTNDSFNLTWLREIIQHLSVVLEEGGSLLDVASKIDFQDVSNVLGVPDLADGVVNLLRDKTVDKLFAGLKEILDDVEPFVDSQLVRADLYSIVDAFESMEIFKNLGLLDMKYLVAEMFVDWGVLRRFLVHDMAISEEFVELISQIQVDMLSIFMKERSAISFKDTVCSQDNLKDMLSFEGSNTNAEEISSILCTLSSSATQNMTITLIQNVNFDYVFRTLMSANVKNILKNANLTETEGKVIFDNIGVVAELVPFFKDKLTTGFTSDTEEKSSENMEEVSSGKFLQDASEMLCGKKLISDNGQFYRIISSIEDKEKAYDERELNSLPTEFCRDTYKNVLGMSGGKIVWSYVKPLLRGRILYAPNSRTIRRVMELANQTFSEIDTFGHLMMNIEKTLVALANLSEMGESLNDLKDIMASKVMKIAIKSMSGGKMQGDLSNFDLGEIAWRLKKSSKLTQMIGMLNDFIECVLVDRMVGFDTEEELEVEARKLTDTNEFLAGVVFMNTQKYTRRSLDEGLPNDVAYKIRMDVDYVPSTKRMKNQFWIPGPEGSFIEDLRYLRGFVQLQDSVDRAIIEIKSGKEQNWKTLSQQMPYPCWKFASFQSTLYESQGLIICFYFALMMCVGSAVRYIVWERESQNAMVMSVMGLKPWRNTCAWFITSGIELTIVMVSICIILIAGKILPNSDPFLVMLLLMDYVFSIVTFCYMISTMFSSASLAAVTTVVMFLLTYMPYVIVIAMEATLGLGYNILLCLSMSTSFCYGCLYATRREVQGIGLTWDRIWEESSPGDPMSLGLILVMIFIDGLLYALVGYVITRYTNSGRDFHGLRSRSLWWADTRSLYGRPSYLAFVNSLYFTNDVLHPSAIYQDEDSDISSMTVNEKQIGVRFETVKKVYQTERGDVVAVDDFSLKLCEGEVTSLLGRNGAGKTTIIKMLTGMVAPTCGEIYLNGDEGTKPDIGVCPQENVLIDTLTPREHMTFYAKLKRPMNNDEMYKNVNAMLASLELGRQEHEPVSRLSGGTKRRLCVALAFLGSPKLVILDEPGAGVDPAARRRIWRLIDQHRVNRTVLLSTHHLDEADMLSDTVVVMHRGKILCTGSPLTLKTTYGQGYWINVAYPPTEIIREIDNKSVESLRSQVLSVVSNATVSNPSGHEVTINLPFQGKHGATNDIAGVIKNLEDNQKTLGFSRITLECDTLEKVFLDLCLRADSGLGGVGGIASPASSSRGSSNSVASISSIELNMIDDTESILTRYPTNPSAFRQVKALLKKRLWHFIRDWRAPLATLILPTIFVAVAMGFSLIRPPSTDEPSIDLNPNLYDTHPTYFYSIDNGSDPFLQRLSFQLHDRFGDDYAGAWQTHPNDTGTCECSLEGQQICHGVSKAVEGLFQTLPGRPTLDWIISTFREYIEKRYGGWSLSHLKEDPLFVVWYNNKGHHSLPAYLNALNEAILRASGVPGHLKTFNHPLKLSSDQLNRTTLLQHVADVGVALVLLIAFNLVAAQGARELVRERLSEEKRILYLAGVHPITYWTTALIWDFSVFVGSIGLAVGVFEIFGLPAYVARDNLPGVCLLLVLFAWASIPFTHLIEKTFDDSSLSNMVLFCLNTFIGVICLATILVIDILGKSQAAKDTRQLLHNIMLLFPQYALGDALVQMSTNDITAELLERFNMDTYKSPLGWELIGPHYVFLFAVGVILYFVNLAIECRIFPNFERKRESYKDGGEDEDVMKERVRVENGANTDVLKTIKLRKEYRSVYGTNVAVQNLSIGIQAGTCFGLLGVNGAGKSTTFKMLTTELLPTAGTIVLKNNEIGRRPLCNGEIGYCPQSDSLDGFLSPHQCLTIHGEVCGLSNVPKAVELMLNRFDLLKYAHQRVSSLSGGNKRKLCAAISVMAPVSVVLMDEPTSGMDPATKELVARIIRQITRAQGAVIMTSHSVAECEKLCNRVGILARAGLRCIGTVQHLKHKFGDGFIAFLRFSQPVTVKELKDAISRHLYRAQVSSRQATAARLMIPRVHDVPLSEIFSRVKRLAEDLKVTDYTLTQSSLDQVLVNFSEELEDDSSDPRYRSLVNAYPSMDTIHMDTFQ
ncbi:uncharacterized protein LOC103571174 isoform X2 [Microplitis demolitor]|nr:uncharacterized protein LOC103571174 isoform X2 [Microplitis demolitor]